MKIEKIILNNFRQFSGENIIEFSTDEKKNITVIHAMNGSGKTTFLQSFFWCLYDELNLPNANRLLNENIFKEMKLGESKEVYVKIHATHEGCKYEIKRSVGVTKHSDSVMRNTKSEIKVKYITEEGKSKLIEDSVKAQNKINSIIPHKLSRYFFFDGERIESLGENNAKARNDIATGIKTILNINIYDSLRSTLEKKVIDSFQKEMKIDGNNKLDLLRDERADLADETNSLRLKKQELEGEKLNICNKIEELDNLIKKNESAVGYKNEYDKNNIKINGLEEEIKNMLYASKNSSKDSLAKTYTKYTIGKLLGAIKPIIELNLDVAGVNEEAIVGINAEAIDKIIDKRQCICGRPITKNEAIVLDNLKQYLPPHDQRVLVYGYKEKFKEKVDSLKDINQDKESLLNDYFDKKEQVQALREKNRELDKLISNIDSVKDFNEERNQKESEKESIIKEIGAIESKINENSKRIEELDKKIDLEARVSEYNDKILERIDFTRMLVSVLEANIEKKKKDIHEKLSKEVNDIFSSVAHKNTKEVLIDEDYSYKIRDKETKHEALSEGEAIITSLSFIASIIKIAKEYEEIKKSEVGEGVEFPLVLDAPFAKLDSIHIKGIAPVLPKFADQVILFTVDQQFKGVTEDNVVDSIGVEYDMANNGDKEVMIKRVR